MSCKALGIALKLTLEGDNQFIYPPTYAFLAVVVAAVVTQVRRRRGPASCSPPSRLLSPPCSLLRSHRS